jgi:hypothetical protein
MSATTSTRTRAGENRPPTPTAPRPADRNWRDRAACRSVDPELFQPSTESGPAHDAQVAEAKAVCAGCPVRRTCLEFALAVLPYGIAGGLTETERARLRSGRETTPKEVRHPIAGTSHEVAAAGRAAVGQGRDLHEVAVEFRVSERTAQRWARETGRTRSTVPSPQGVSS